jgi:regulator of nucleoside diphosphate kinase
MNGLHEVLVCARDAETLASLVGSREMGNRLEEATDALSEVLMEASFVPDKDLPANRVAMNSRVTYSDANGSRRTVSVVHPRDADPSRLRISVLSPVGRALLGRRAGSTIRATVPDGREIALHILDVERGL